MSSETKWTPGPWHSRGFPTISAGKGKGMIVKVLERYMDRAEREANAHLIAAAPDLYEALEYLLRHNRELVAQGVNIDAYLMSSAYAALAKARGEHS